MIPSCYVSKLKWSLSQKDITNKEVKSGLKGMLQYLPQIGDADAERKSDRITAQFHRLGLRFYLVRCSRAIARAPGSSRPTVGRLPWVEGRVSQPTGVQHRVVKRCLKTKRAVNIYQKKTWKGHARVPLTATHIRGGSKHRQVKSWLFHTGLGWLRASVASVHLWRPKLGKRCSFGSGDIFRKGINEQNHM